MDGEWKQVKLGTIARVKGGKRLPLGSRLQALNNCHPYIRVVDISNGMIDHDSLLFVPDEVYPQISQYTVESGDVIVSIVGTIGLVAQITSELDGANLTENAAKVCIDDPNVDSAYVMYYLKAPNGQHEIKKNTVGSTQLKLPLYGIQNIEVLLPELSVQRKIAHILSSIDGKISLNRRVNDCLEEIARVIFKHWFIDFEFPNENGEPYKSSGGETINSPLGPIPKGWRIGRIEDVCEFSYGKALKADKRIQGRIPVYGSNGQIGWHNESLVSGPGIIVGRKGNPGLIHWSKEDFFPIDTTFYVVQRVGKSIMHFLYFALKHADLPRLSADSAVPGLNRNIAYMQQLVIPTEQLLRDFENRISIIFDLLQTNCWQNQSLSELRDSLLPKLMSGEIRVPVSEKEVDQL